MIPGGGRTFAPKFSISLKIDQQGAQAEAEDDNRNLIQSFKFHTMSPQILTSRPKKPF